MIRKSLFIPLAAGLLFTSVFIACQKDARNSGSEEETERVAAVTEDDAEADVIFDDVNDQVIGVDGDLGIGPVGVIFGRVASTNEKDELILNGGATLDSVPRCVTVTISAGGFPKTVTIDFGTGCTGRDGKTRKGMIKTTYTDRLVVPGAVAETQFIGYYVDSVKVEGTHRIKNNSTSAVRIFTRTVINGKLSKPSGNYISWNATHTNTQTAGLGTPGLPLDDEFDITGGGQGENKRGSTVNTWQRLIVNPLHKKFTCRWFSEGTVRITRNGVNGVLDFGSGTCDNKATLTVAGFTRFITLR